MKSSYDEPIVMWHLRHNDGRRAHAVIVPHGAKTAALWLIGGIPQNSKECGTLHGAIRWLERELVKLQVAGWHLWDPPKPVRTAGLAG